MKKIIFVILCLCMAISSYATASNAYQFEYEDSRITIIFEETSTFTPDERQTIADILVYGDSESEDSSTYAWCWLTGHDYVYNSVSAIEHKVSDLAPRCYRTTYRVETCNNCDHMEYTELSSIYIDCCPEE